MQSPPLDDLNASLAKQPLVLLPTRKSPKTIMSVYHSTEFLYPKDGVWKEDNVVVTKSLSLLDDDAVSTVLPPLSCQHISTLTSLNFSG